MRTADAVATIGWLLFLLLWPRAVSPWLAVQGPRAPEPDARARVAERLTNDSAAAMEARQPTATPAVAWTSTRRGVLLHAADDGDLVIAERAARRHVPWATREGLSTVPPPSADTTAPPRALQDARVAVLASKDAVQTEAALDQCAAAGVPLLLPRLGAAPSSTSSSRRA